MTFEPTEQWQVCKPSVVCTGGVVTAQHWRAARVGAAILTDGGNAVDAAVGTALALQTCEPWMSGLAASGYALVRPPNGPVTVIDFTGIAPAGCDPSHYPIDPAAQPSFLGFPSVVGNRNVVGWGAVCVPGAVAGLSAALDRFGTIGWDRALAPTIDLADQGIAVDWHATLAIALAAADLSRDAAAREMFLPGGVPPAPGRRLPLPTLGKTLRTLADAGPDSFYRGAIAEALVADARDGGSTITAEDLDGYRPVIGSAQGLDRSAGRIAVPPVTSGGQRLIDTLTAIDGVTVDADGFVALAEALQTAFATHRRRLGHGEPEGGSTTHVNAVDRDGMMVAITFTLLNRFGARVVSPRTGVLMNNGIAWFDPRPGLQNSLAPKQRAANNMCPVLAERPDGGGWLALGASGGNQIVPALAQLIWFIMEGGLSVDAAMHAPRIDTGFSRVVRAYPTLEPAAMAALSARFPVTISQPVVFPRLYASPSAIEIAADGRRHAQAEIGYPSAGAAADARPDPSG